MFHPHFSTCSQCQKQSLLVVKKLLCKKCNNERKRRTGISNDKSNVGKQPKKIASSKNDTGRVNRKIPINRRRNTKNKISTGQKEIFLEIWEERQHTCQVCSKGLGEEPLAQFFSHILSKGRYPKLKLDKRNIWLCCFDCHYQYEFGNKSDPKFAEKNKVAEMLKIEYNQNKL